MREDHRRDEEALRRSEENFRAIFDYVPAAVYSYNRWGVILQANPASEQLFGFPIDRLVGHSIFETIASPEDRERREAVIAQVFAGQSFENLEWQDIKADGTRIYVLMNTTPVFDPSGRVITGLSLSVDITERKLAEQREREGEAHKRDFYRRTILAATEGKLEITERDEIVKIAGPPIASWEIHRGEDLSAIRDAIAGIAESAGMDERRVFDFVLAAGEATTNVIKHVGNGTASLHRKDDSLLLVVSDRGSGIEELALPDVALKRGYTTAVSLGIGYKAIISVADKVYLATGPGGTTVAIEMKLHAPEKPVPGANIPAL
ncbi:MAG: PAS domain S-box protein [Armatimonadota bacterium]